MKRALFVSVLFLAGGSAVTACGKDEHDEKNAAQGCTGDAACAGSGGASSEGGGVDAPSGTGGFMGLEKACSDASGTLLASGPCYKGCLFNGSKEPLYDDQADCVALGYQCGIQNYCIPHIKCTSDAACQNLGGPGWLCAKDGPLVGQCLIGCTSDVDCPVAPGPTPYRCQAVYEIMACRT